MKQFLDETGRIKIWPVKRVNQVLLLRYLAKQFVFNTIYTEKQINEIIENNHTFGDLFLLRRGLIDERLISRVPNGSKYWKSDPVKSTFETERLIIRDSVISDAEDLKGVNSSCGYMERFTGVKHEDSYIDKILSEGDVPPSGSREFYRIKTIINKEQNETIGFMEYYLGYPEVNTVWISTLYIKPSFQQKGFGLEIIDNFKKQLSDTSVNALAAGVHLKNWPALRFWVKCGFSEVIGIYGDKEYDNNHYSVIGLKAKLPELHYE